MEFLQLNNGVQMPMLGFGTVGVHGEAGVQQIVAAVQAGYRLIDTARMYQNEETVGQGIRACGVAREELFLTTKLNKPSCVNYAQAAADIDDSLQKLGVGYVDLLLIHEPYRGTPEAWRAVREAYAAGKARAIGVSNFNHKCYSEFLAYCEVVPAINQLECNVYFTQSALQMEMEAHGTKMQAWSPLACGKKDFFHEPLLVAIGAAHGKTVAQVALRYLVQKGVAAIPKTGNPQRLRENIDIFNFMLSNAEMQQIAAMDEGVSTTDWYRTDWF